MKTKSDGLKGIKRIPLFPSFGTPARTWRRMARRKEGRKEGRYGVGERRDGRRGGQHLYIKEGRGRWRHKARLECPPTATRPATGCHFRHVGLTPRDLALPRRR